MKPMLLLLLLGGWQFTVPGGEPTSALLDKVVAAYGGRARLAKLSFVRETGRVEGALGLGSSGPLLRLFQPPRRLKVEVGDGGGREVRLLDGAKAWHNGNPASGVALDAMVLQALRLDLPRALVRQKEVWREKPPMQVEGKTLRVLEMSLDGGLSVAMGVDPASGRILFSRGETDNRPSGPVRFETFYQDFRPVDGVLFAFKEVNQVGGLKVGETVLTKVELLPKPPKNAFQP